MKTEIKIILEEGASNKAKGNCFEDLIRNILTLHLYEVRGNINFAGLEIDLIGIHKHTGETLYVECKAKEKVSSDELSKFCFNVDHKEADKGYFFRTQELESQAGALLSEIKKKPKNKNLTFFEPDDIISILKDANKIFEPLDNLKNYNISKKIFIVSYFGDFFVYLIKETLAFPTQFIVINAKTNEKPVISEQVKIFQKFIVDIRDLEVISNSTNYVKKNQLIETLIETISEVQESENWYDYKPASSEKKHFIGRDIIRTNILTFFKEIQTNESKKRIFYLNGKSGWGKSSLVLEIKGRCRNKHFKNKFFCLAIDTRSATSDNFVALSVKKLIDLAIQDSFIKTDIFSKEVNFTSNFDILSSDSIKELFKNLELNGKFLVLIFDQFEDVFRKKDFFKSFYKFLSDVTDKKPNLIVGFSWKSDFFIQSDDPAYHIWQQAKDQAREFTIDEFGEKEIDGIIKQLEGSVGDLDKSIKDRIKESSQGLPWLTKKLCIHIFDQIEQGLLKENLIESNLNIAELFKNDEERVNNLELKALNIIAKRAYDGNFFDETEVGDLIESNTITSLLHKRLIIRSGANYNIYWDIFRDYLVTRIIPPIGESYLLRQMVNSCIDVFLLFENSHKKETLNSLLTKYSKGIGEETLNNILIELRNIGIVQKEFEQYKVVNGIDISRDSFIKYITDKFQNYTPYIVLKKANFQKISKENIIDVLKNIFKQEFQDNTWDAYAKTLISWFLISNLDIKSKLVEPKKGRGNSFGISKSLINIKNSENAIPKSSIKDIIELIPLLLSDISSINSRFFRDLFLLKIIENDKQFTQFGKELALKDSTEMIKILKKKVLELPKMKEIKSVIDKNPKIKALEILRILPADFFDGHQQSSKIIYVSKALTWLK